MRVILCAALLLFVLALPLRVALESPGTDAERKRQAVRVLLVVGKWVGGIVSALACRHTLCSHKEILLFYLFIVSISLS